MDEHILDLLTTESLDSDCKDYLREIMENRFKSLFDWFIHCRYIIFPLDYFIPVNGSEKFNCCFKFDDSVESKYVARFKVKFPWQKSTCYIVSI